MGPGHLLDWKAFDLKNKTTFTRLALVLSMERVNFDASQRLFTYYIQLLS